MSRRRALLAGAASLGVLAGSSLTDSADANTLQGVPGIVFNGCAGVGRADNKTHSFYYENVDPFMVTHLNNHRAYMDAQTAMTTTGSSGGSLTDAYVRDQNYTDFCGLNWHNPTTGTGVLGYSVCIALNAQGECERSDIRFDTSLYPQYTTHQKQSLACHEVGHSIGLDHEGLNRNCMQQGSVGLQATVYTTHDKNHMANDIQ